MASVNTEEDLIASLNARMLASLSLPPPAIGPEPLMCPVCGTTRVTCLQFYGRDREHEAQILGRLDEAAAKIIRPR